MTTPNTLISLRITDEELALLDARVGLDGARNRSDVIRAAIRSFLEDQPLLPDMDTITIPVGRSMKSILGDLYELHGISHQQAASQGLQDYVRKIIQEETSLNEILAEGLEVARSKTVGRSMKSILGDLYELHGISHQQAASQGLQDYVRKMIQEEAQLNEILAEGLEVARSKTVGRKEFTE